MCEALLLQNMNWHKKMCYWHKKNKKKTTKGPRTYEQNVFEGSLYDFDYTADYNHQLLY